VKNGNRITIRYARDRRHESLANLRVYRKRAQQNNQQYHEQPRVFYLRHYVLTVELQHAASRSYGNELLASPPTDCSAKRILLRKSGNTEASSYTPNPDLIADLYRDRSQSKKFIAFIVNKLFDA